MLNLISRFFVVFSLCSYAALHSVYGQVARAENSNKLGAVFNIYTGNQVIVDNSNTDMRSVKTTPLVGVGAFYEMIASSFFGYELRGSIVQQKTFLEVDGANTDVATSMQYAGGAFRAYTTSHKRTGDNWYGAVNVGLYNVKMKFETGPQGLAGRDTSFALLAYGLEGGIDYILKFAGLRGSVGYQFGQATAKNSPGDIYRISYNSQSIVLSAGVFSFF